MSGVGGMSLLAAGMALSACSSSSSTTTSASGLAKVNFQLGWLANVENMGLFMADHAATSATSSSTSR
ncbi:hypothetical protein ACFQX6_22090 [Streptosporangium lutulentum]